MRRNRGVVGGIVDLWVGIGGGWGVFWVFGRG